MLHDALTGGSLKPVDDGDVAWVLIGGEPGSEPGRERCRVDLGAGARLHEQFDLVLADLGSDADHGAILDLRVGGGDALDLPGRDVLTAAADAVGRSPEEGQ